MRVVLDELPGFWLRHVTLTQLEDDEALLWRRVAGFAERLRGRRRLPGRARRRFEYAGAYEVGRGGHGHAHLVSWGDYIDQAELAELWSAACGYRAIVYVQAVRGDARQVAAYVAKGLTRYVTKGGRRVNYSRGFTVFGARLLDELRRAR